MRIEMEMNGPRLVARLGIGFAESHAAPHERALGSLVQAPLRGIQCPASARTVELTSLI